MLGRVIVVTAVAVLSLPVPSEAVEYRCEGQVATIVGGRGPNRIHGTSGPDVIVGLDGNDHIYGGGGDDIICGGDGSDWLDGEQGDDRLHGGRDATTWDDGHLYTTGDLLTGGPGDDSFIGGLDLRGDRVRSRDEIRMDAAPTGVLVEVEQATITGDGSDDFNSQPWEIRGSRFRDVMNGGPSSDDLRGGGGKDAIRGGDGDDRLRGGKRDDVIEGGGGSDILVAGGGEDVLRGGDGPDYLYARDHSADQLYGEAGDDRIDDLLVGRGLEVVDGGTGGNLVLLAINTFREVRRAELDLGSGTGLLHLRNGSTAPVAVSGADRLYVERGRWRVRGTKLHDHIKAVRATLIAFGLEGDDLLMGANRDDYLNGGPGEDTTVGRRGTDICRSAENLVGCEITG